MNYLSTRNRFVLCMRDFVSEQGILCIKNRFKTFSYLEKQGLLQSKEYCIFSYNYRSDAINYLINAFQKDERENGELIVKQSIQSLLNIGLNELVAYRALELLVASFDFFDVVDAQLLNSIGKFYLFDDSIKEGKTIATEYFLLSAEKANCDAAYNLSLCYASGLGVMEDEANAFKWCKRAALGGNVVAQATLGNWLLQENNRKDGFYWLSKAANNGNADAQLLLALKLLTNDKADKDGVRFLHMAAESGNKDALLSMGIHYLNDNPDVAINYLSQAVVKGDPYAAYLLGALFLEGKHVEQNLFRAIELLKKAAYSDLVEAQELLGDCYIYIAGRCDIKEARKWYNMAVEQGSETAREKLDNLLI